MSNQDRRHFLRAVAGAAGATAAMTSFPPAIARALAIPANRRTGTIRDVEHIVILMQENRSFDHYFGTLNGVRGFADRFPIPVPDQPGIAGKTVWTQPNQVAGGLPAAIAPFRLNTQQNFPVMRVQGTPHSWADAQLAWDQGRMSTWPRFKANHSMGHYAQADLPFQWALVNAFTICDAYHCSSQTGTNTNRLYQWTGTNDPLGKGNGPATYNDYDWFESDPGQNGGYTWTTYPERLEAAGISWQVYENMEDNFTDNPLAGFQSFRAAWFDKPGASAALKARGVSTRDLDKLKEDVLADRLPQVSWIVATAEGSEHPGPSSPAQGADYTAKVLEALTANPEVWSKTVLFLNFDENDGFFDHVPPPAVPSYVRYDADADQAVLAGASTVDTSGEYHEVIVPYRSSALELSLKHRPYGLGPRVPMYVISPWSKGGWVNSEVADHTSVIRFIEKRFGVREPNISAWRRTVCGDMTSAFNFADPDNTAFFQNLPTTLALANQARALPGRTLPLVPAQTVLPVQADGVRPSCALPYELEVHSRVVSRWHPHREASAKIHLSFVNTGRAGAVFHVYDRLRLAELPRRYTVGAGQRLAGTWLPAAGGAYDLWVLGPNGFHRHFTGDVDGIDDDVAHGAGFSGLGRGRPSPDVHVEGDARTGELVVRFFNVGNGAARFVLEANRYYVATKAQYQVVERSENVIRLPLGGSNHWYDFSVRVTNLPGFSRRFAGRLETGAPSVSDPAMYGPAIGEQYKVGG
jgi:phospholipase C